MSYVNVIMYSSVLPTYDSPKNKEAEFDESKDANNPDNFRSDADEIVVKA